MFSKGRINPPSSGIRPQTGYPLGDPPGTRLVTPLTTTGIIRPRKDKILSGMFSKGR